MLVWQEAGRLLVGPGQEDGDRARTGSFVWWWNQGREAGGNNRGFREGKGGDYRVVLGVLDHISSTCSLVKEEKGIYIGKHVLLLLLCLWDVLCFGVFDQVLGVQK